MKGEKYHYFVLDFSRPIKGQGCGTKSFWFDTFEDYWEYRKLEANRLDCNMSRSGDDPTGTLYEPSNYSERYYDNIEDFKLWKSLLDDFHDKNFVLLMRKGGRDIYIKRGVYKIEIKGFCSIPIDTTNYVAKK